MKRYLQFSVVCTIIVHATAALAGEGAWRFTSIDVPNARATFAYGLGPSGDIVGVYVDAAGKQHGFLLRDGELTAIDAPGAAATDARGIAPDGTIVGSFRYPGEPALVSRGYLRTHHGSFEPANYPNHISTIPQRILPDGTILGCYHDTDTMHTMRGIAMSSSGNSELDLFASMTNGGTPDGRIRVGSYTEMETMKGRAFVVIDGEVSGFDYPGARLTTAWDVNARGTVVGGYLDGTGTAHGFVLKNGKFTPVDVPDARATTVFGINARGDIVGRYIDTANRTRGFIATRPADDNDDPAALTDPHCLLSSGSCRVPPR